MTQGFPTAEPRRARPPSFVSSEVLARVTVAFNCENRLRKLPLGFIWELSSEKKLQASRFSLGEGGTRFNEGDVWIAKSWVGKSKDSTKRVFSGVGLARLLLFRPAELLISGLARDCLPNGVICKMSLEVLNLWGYDRMSARREHRHGFK